MRKTALSIFLFFITANLSAQVNLGESPTVLFATPASNGCPIGIVAERRSPAIVSTVGTASPAPSTQGIKLQFQHPFTSRIEQVAIVVHGLSRKNRIMPAGATADSDVEEIFHLTRAEQSASLSESYLQPKSVFTTQWVELISVVYTDGSSWRALRDRQCAITPSNFLLVSAR